MLNAKGRELKELQSKVDEAKAAHDEAAKAVDAKRQEHDHVQASLTSLAKRLIGG